MENAKQGITRVEVCRAMWGRSVQLFLIMSNHTQRDSDALTYLALSSK